jgi:hypothetical protein
MHVPDTLLKRTLKEFLYFSKVAGSLASTINYAKWIVFSAKSTIHYGMM